MNYASNKKELIVCKIKASNYFNPIITEHDNSRFLFGFISRLNHCYPNELSV